MKPTAAATLLAGALWFAGCGDVEAPSAGEEPSQTATPTPTEVSPSFSPADPPHRHAIPDDFPLLNGYPTDAQSEGGEYGRKGPSRDLDPVEPTACGETVRLPRFVDWLRGGWANVEDFRERQLILFADAERAQEYADDVIGIYRACPDEDHEFGSILTVVEDGDLGDWSAVAASRYFQALDDGEYPTTGMTTTQVVRVGRAVLVASESNEGGAAVDAPANGIRWSTDAIRGVVDAMGPFAVEYPSEPPFGPEGFGQVTLGMPREQVLAIPGVRITGGNDQCDSFEAPGVSGGLQPGLGVAYLFASADLETPERIGEGSTYDEVLAAYPDAEGDRDILAADPPGFDDRYYRIELWRGEVSEIVLMHRDQRCAS